MSRHAFFESLAGEENPPAFIPEHALRIERLRCRPGDLRDKQASTPGGQVEETLAASAAFFLRARRD